MREDAVNFVRQLTFRKQELEQDLHDLILDRLRRFERETGWSPKSIQIDMLDTTSIDDIPLRRFTIGRVEVKLFEI